MNVKQLIRDAEKVKSTLVELPDGRLVTKVGCKILIPCRFEEKGLAHVGIDNSIIGIYAMVVEDAYYAISLVNAMLNIDPTSTSKILIDGDDYYEFTFVKGSTVFKSLNLVKIDTLVYRIYDEIFSKGRIPWYLGYNDLAGIFDTAKEHAGANIGQNREVTELIVSVVARDPTDKTKYYRSVVKSMAEVETNPPATISLRDVTYAPGSTLNRLAGSYMSVGIVASLNNPSDKTERIEKILRA